jgi:hypothetical protein
MDRTSFRFAAFVATACLMIACCYVRADIAAAQSDSPAPAAEEPPQGDPPPATPTEAAAPPAGSTPSQEAGSAGASAPGEVAPVQEWVQPESPTDPSPTGTGSSAAGTGSTPAATESAPGSAPGSSGSHGGAATAPTQRIDETPPASTDPDADETAAFASSTSAANPSAEQAPESRVAAAAAVTPSKPAAAAEAATTPTDQPGGTLEGLLSDVRQELRSAQGQINDLQRRMDDGAPPPPDRLTRLRATLVQIAPMLVALEVRLQAAGRLTPHLRHLLHRVRSDLRGVRVTAHGLVTALRRSGARGPELRLLLRELEHFVAIGSDLAWTPGVRPAAAPLVAGASPAYSQLQPAPVAGPPPAVAPTAERRAPDHPPPESDGRRNDEPPPWSSAPSAGSATASPGGAFFFAGAAFLTMLLIGLGLPALRARLELPPGRRYTAAFLAPLERPG